MNTLATIASDVGYSRAPPTCNQARAVNMPLNQPAAASFYGPQLLVRRSLPRPTVVYDTYWRFAAERQEIYFKRFQQDIGPWSHDPILANHRFTNAYRAADRVSQYLINSVIYDGSSRTAESDIFRILLFKIFNKVETWQVLALAFGDLSLDNFEVDAFDQVLQREMLRGTRIYSAAYIMPTAPVQTLSRFKHRTHLDLLFRMFQSKFPRDVLRSKSLAELYRILLGLPSIGPFLAYQYSIDLMYSEHVPHDEDDFVQPGPGAINGIVKCFSSLGDFSPAEAIAWATDQQEAEFTKRGYSFKTLWGRRLHLIDCQNLFCEVDKYSRVAHPEIHGLSARSRIKQRYVFGGVARHPKFPPKWNLETSGLPTISGSEP